MVGFVAAIAATGQASRPPASATEGMYQVAAQSADRKIRHIASNGTRSQPDPRPTDLTEREINAYLQSGAVELPRGVSRLRLEGLDNTVTAHALVDFDVLTEGRRSSNPLLYLFSGTHDVDVVADAVGIGGEGRVYIKSVAIDGVNVPRAALEMFVNRYVKPKYPNLGLNSHFALPARIDSAVVGNHVLTVRQK